MQQIYFDRYTVFSIWKKGYYYLVLNTNGTRFFVYKSQSLLPELISIS